MAEIVIRQRYRGEFDGLTIEQMQAGIRTGQWDSEKRLHAIAYVEEKLHGEDRAIARRQAEASERAAIAVEISAKMATRANRRAWIAAIISLISLAGTWWPRIQPYLAGWLKP